MACRVTLTVGAYFGVYLPYLAPDFYELTLIFGMPTAGVGGSLNKGLFLYAGSTLNNPEKLVVISRAEGVGVVVFGGVRANREWWGWFCGSGGRL